MTDSGEYGRASSAGAMGPETTKFARIDPGPSRRFGIIGSVFVLVGAVLAVIAFTALNWFKSSDSHFSTIHDQLGHVGGLATGPAKAYFGWAGWALLIVAVVLALLALTPTVSTPFRILAPLVCLAAMVVTVPSLKLIHGKAAVFGTHGHLADYVKQASAGFYVTLAGFLLIGIGAVLGPRRTESD